MADLATADLRPFVPARDFGLSKKFYASLGWSLKDVADGLALVQPGERSFYLQDHYVKAFAQNTVLHLGVADAQAWYEHVAAVLRDGKFEGAHVQAPKRQPYGALVTFVHDPAGVLLQLCQWDR